MAFSAKNLLFSDEKKQENSPNFEENVKNSFKRAKEHTILLESEIKASKETIIKQNEQILALLNEIKQIKGDLDVLKDKIDEKPQSSSGNEGVSLNGYAVAMHSTDKQMPIISSINMIKDPPMAIAKSFQSIEEMCNGLSKQELLTLITLYQLENELGNVSYLHIAEKLHISEGCVRTYICSLIKKGMPISKKKFNNKIVFLTIFPEYKTSSLGRQLESVYYKFDPTQKRLVEHY